MSKPYTARLGETLIVSLAFDKELKLNWRPLFQYSVGEFVTIGALVYECTNAGLTGLELPENLNTTIAGTQADGTVIWTVRDFSLDGSDTIASQTVTAATGITIDASSITKNVYVSVTFTTTARGNIPITCEIDTANGETIIMVVDVLVK